MSTTDKESEIVTEGYIAIDEAYDYSTEVLLQIDEMTIINEEETAMTYLNTFWQNMESTLRGYPIMAPNDFRTLFRQNKELVILPTVRAGVEEELIDSAESKLNSIIRDGDYVMLLFASTEDDWRLDGILYEDFREAINNCFTERARLFFGSTIPDEHQPYTRPLQVSILVLHKSKLKNLPVE